MHNVAHKETRGMENAGALSTSSHLKVCQKCFRGKSSTEVSLQEASLNRKTS